MARQERAIRTRHAIVAASAEVFDEVGYEAATISEILKRSGVTKGALYFHFTSKEELAQEVLASQLRAVPQVPTGDLTLQQVVDESLLLSYLLNRGDSLVRGSIRLTVDQGSPADGLDRRVPMQAWIDHGVALFGKAKADGELLPHVDVDAVAKMFVGGFTGIQILSNILTRHADITERVADLHRTLMTAIAVPGVLVRLDFSPDRAARVYEAAMAQRREQEALEAAGVDG
ncbi:TetR/AcrR family transcriptional regulator [Streptomyces sp. WAC05374]|uniref:ScbR family autoregulator-binding transcription factor n=1 Tax=Streptomyces sp. WAC05374 TaxID=2487420 RepID=UPI000F87DFF2|nr:ScbR family autoregulator-binding transcription factor [Streptomyces sp. WAC05374]RST16669.1 TetR/AcrR family transcriptional regulator [Streptomyces sp. WAC05374]TDF35996.1 TetR/AcrR family transcriptional regulator [Streptomyces sp. WAC05374]TDF44559.1 TetR/AcrR family transcriptional regulator [Streptomyces sp. WAC05374]TDF45689.1 TetR/AcrR family transcriptional regulator [Streptomyces sp. WAC05374]